jgi:hypothetical protein
MRARCQGLAIEAFMIALATDTPPAIIECREHKPASARSRLALLDPLLAPPALVVSRAPLPKGGSFLTAPW